MLQKDVKPIRYNLREHFHDRKIVEILNNKRKLFNLQISEYTSVYNDLPNVTYGIIHSHNKNAQEMHPPNFPARVQFIRQYLGYFRCFEYFLINLRMV